MGPSVIEARTFTPSRPFGARYQATPPASRKATPTSYSPPKTFDPSAATLRSASWYGTKCGSLAGWSVPYRRIPQGCSPRKMRYTDWVTGGQRGVPEVDTTDGGDGRRLNLHDGRNADCIRDRRGQFLLSDPGREER